MFQQNKRVNKEIGINSGSRKSGRGARQRKVPDDAKEKSQHVHQLSGGSWKEYPGKDCEE